VGSLIFIILAFLCGGITIVSMIINARLAQEIGTLQGGFINYTVGLLVTMLVLLIIMFTGNFTTGTLTGIPFYAFLGGFVGVMVVIASNIVIPRLMRILNLKSVCRRKRKNYIKSIPEVTAENILNREFDADSFGKKWLTDVTEMKYGPDKKAYLSAILDQWRHSGEC